MFELNHTNALVDGWKADMTSSDGGTPRATRLRLERPGLLKRPIVLINMIEWVEWNENPVQVIICDQCGTVGCAIGGYATVATTPTGVLFAPPNPIDYLDDDDDDDQDSAEEEYGDYAHRKVGPFLVRAPEWDRWRSIRRGPLKRLLPAIERLPRMRRSDLQLAWTADTNGLAADESSAGLVEHVRDSLLTADTLAAADAIEILEKLVSWIDAAPLMETHGDIVLAPPGTTFENFYLDGPSTITWPAVARLLDGHATFGFTNGFVYIPADEERDSLPRWPA